MDNLKQRVAVAQRLTVVGTLIDTKRLTDNTDGLPQLLKRYEELQAELASLRAES